MKKGSTWHFEYKANVSAGKGSGLVHTVEVTAANTHDVTVTPKLLTGEEEEVYGDSGYLGAEKRKDALTMLSKRIKPENESVIKSTAAHPKSKNSPPSHRHS